MRDDRDVGARHEPSGEQPRVHRDGLEVAAESLADRDRGLDPARSAQTGDRAGERGGERRAVGHEVGDAGEGTTAAQCRVPDPGDDRGHGRVEVRDDDGEPCEVLRVAQ